MVEFIDANRTRVRGRADLHACCRSPRAPTTPRSPARRPRGPSATPCWAAVIMTLWVANYSVYGAHKMWKALDRAGEDVGRDQVARIMRQLGIQGARRGGKVFTTRPDDKAARPPDLVDRKFTADRPNALVGDRPHLRADMVRDGVCVLHRRRVQPDDRRLAGRGEHAHRHGPRRDRDGPLPPRHDDRRARVPLRRRLSVHRRCATPNGSTRSAPSPRSGRSRTATTTRWPRRSNGLYKTELTRRQGPWSTIEDVELATLGWVHWFNTERLHGTLGDIPPAEFEDRHYAQLATEQVTGKPNHRASIKPRAVHNGDRRAIRTLLDAGPLALCIGALEGGVAAVDHDR